MILPKLLSITAVFISFSASTWSPHAASAGLDAPINILVKSNDAGVASQQKIDEMVQDTRSLLDQYLDYQTQLDQLTLNNDYLQTLIKDQLAQLVSLKSQLSSIDETNRQLTPMMLDMIKTLELFVQLDVPFLKDERQARIDKLYQTFGRSDVTIATKYRSILEAFEIENDYGRTIETYRSSLMGSKETDRLVDYFRLGRVALYYLAIDGSEAGIWNQQNKTWSPLGNEYLVELKNGIAMAKKRAAPALLNLPLPAPSLADNNADPLQGVQ